MYSADTFSFSPNLLTKLGLPSIEDLCTYAGIAVATTFDTSDFFRLWEAADEVLEDRAAGLHFGVKSIEGGYATGSMVALHAPCFRSALANLARYKRLTCPERVEVEVSGNEVRVHYHWLQATRSVPRLLVDTTMAALRELARRGTAGGIAPIRLALARAHSDQRLLARHFGCPIDFRATHDFMVFERSALDMPFVTAHDGAFHRLIDDLETQLRIGGQDSSLVADVRVAIARQLSEGRAPSLAALASRLALSSRTMQRRLDESNTSFQAQLGDVRRTTARRLLLNTELDPVAIAMLLGFVEPNSFLRAFRVWEQTTPLRWRDRHTRSQGSL
ncbi:MULTISPECIES: AraC family transcriptional regulator ligand-binding domain-containing protein [Pandoraea]|uniref:AraC family transcriptional regulator ligand-binding domain-containing protein n=1 Tax=Pandoraea TaxID=93217 RepID=UPI001F5CB2D7|nr:MULTISPECIES: AraC family transcriptional regulator ligand-binding domain-containing protein [Pandoraea]MCI3208646.1 AraC family transcriptional regulator [Pandoraea sp. LA3]MDN4586675.1 AraC family transcriptional regulator [Pandoraea capi]